MLEIVNENLDDYKNVYILSDIHGNVKLFNNMLNKIELKKDDLLIIAGDSCDRGIATSSVYEKILDLIKNGFKIIHLMGNHEKMFYEYITFEENKKRWMLNGGEYTLKSYESLDKSIINKHLEFIENMPFMVNIGEYLIVHAGVNPFEKLEEQTEDEILWIRDKFICSQQRKIKKTIIFGHTPTENGKIFFYKNDIIGIDCGSYKNNRLGAIELKNKKEYYTTGSDGDAKI